MHHAHHRRHNTEGRQAVAQLGDHVGGNRAFVVVGLDLVVHQVFDLEGVHVARHHEAQVVGHEFHDMVVGQHRRVFREQGRGFRLLDVAFDRHQAFLADLGQHVEQERHQLHVHVLGVVGTLEDGREGLHGGLDRLAVVTDEECADRGAADHQELQRLEQRCQVAAAEGEAAEHGSADDDVTNND